MLGLQDSLAVQNIIDAEGSGEALPLPPTPAPLSVATASPPRPRPLVAWSLRQQRGVAPCARLGRSPVGAPLPASATASALVAGTGCAPRPAPGIGRGPPWPAATAYHPGSPSLFWPRTPLSPRQRLMPGNPSRGSLWGASSVALASGFMRSHLCAGLSRSCSRRSGRRALQLPHRQDQPQGQDTEARAPGDESRNV